MQNYLIRLETPVATSFRCQKAANSLDIDTAKKAVHQLAVDADVTSNFNVGLIVGAPPAVAAPVSVAFGFTGATQTFVVPAGVTSVDFELCGARGGGTAMSLGGAASTWSVRWP